jgi:DNA-binding transcriptional LysR family regulator
MDLFGALGILVRVVETGSFSAVARERELSQAAVARQISQLEEHFGVRLFHRTTRKLSLTDDGEMLLGLARPLLDGVDGLEAALGRQSASRGGQPPSRGSSPDLARRSSGAEGRARGE